MKLINKTQRLYITLVLVLLIVWSGIFLIAIYSAIEENIDETLQSELLEIVQQSNNGEAIQPISAQQIQIISITAVRDTSIIFSDTTLFNNIEKELFSYRQVETEASISSTPYRIILRRSLVEYDDLFEAILIMELIFMVLLISGLFAINRSILQRIWEPFYHTLAEVGQYKIGRNQQVEWRDTEIDEFQQLNEVLQKMIGQIEQEYKSLKQFTENASHEIQTPLSIINARIEMLLQDDGLRKDQWQSLLNLYEAANRLSRINRALLMLTKIENNNYTSKEPVNLSNMMTKLLNEYDVQTSQHKLSIQNEISGGVIISANSELMELLLRNMITNAIKHNMDEGIIHLELNQNGITIFNTGKKPKEDTSHYFKRFVKRDESSASLGLGLAIVKEICRAHNFRCSYTYKNKRHIMEVQF